MRPRSNKGHSWFQRLFGAPSQAKSDPAVTAGVIRPSREVPREPSPYAEPGDYNPKPILTLREWDFGKGLRGTSDGYAFTAPDGKIWPAGNCQWSFWKELGVLKVNVVGERYHLPEIRTPGFSPGQPIRLVPEPNNPHSKTGKAISIRDESMSRRAGYVKSGSAARLRNMLDGLDFYAMVLAADYEDTARTRRTEVRIVVFRPGRVKGHPEMNLHPPLDELADDFDPVNPTEGTDEQVE